MRARVPASSSNLGPGYDVLGLALRMYVEVEVLPAARLHIVSEGEGSDLPADESHLAAAVVRSVLGHDRVALHVRSSIPVSRGLGSSAALAVAAAAAAGGGDPLAVGAAVDGHAENAAASMLGGLVAATMIDGAPVARRLPLDGRLGFVIVVPDRHLPTKLARSVLPATVPLGDVIHNLGRMGLLVAGLADASSLFAGAGDDRLHQGPRAALFPEAPELLDRLRAGGATVACWSGAGPAMLAICADGESALKVESAAVRALSDLGLPGQAAVIEPDLEGLVVTS
ncbi:MAG: homoserine kinase [Acidimicrobiales bacterium]